MERYNQVVDSFNYQEYCVNWPSVISRYIDYTDIKFVGNYTLPDAKQRVNTVRAQLMQEDFVNDVHMNEKEIQEWLDTFAPKAPEKLSKQLLLCQVLVKPGKHTYQFALKSTGRPIRQSQVVFCDQRTEEIPFNLAESTKNKLKGTFEKNSSVFVDWKDDESTYIKMMTEADFKNWGVHKLIKESIDVSNQAQ